MKIKIVKKMVHMTVLGANSQRLNQWRAKGSDAGPHIKTLYKEESPTFKFTNILNR